MHGIELGSNGQAAFASRQAPAWHDLGTVFDDTLTTDEMLSVAYLSDWNVRLESVPDVLSMISDSYTFNTVPYMVVRDNPFSTGKMDVLSVVGERYHVLSNEDMFGFAGDLLNTDGAYPGGVWETAGSIKGGRVIFGSIKLNRQVIIGKGYADDVTDLYLLVVTSHDGSLPITVMITPVRVVCQNTLNMAFGEFKQRYVIRHTKNSGEKLKQLKQVIAGYLGYVDEFETKANELFARTVTNDKFDKIIRAVYAHPGEDAAKNSLTRWDNRRDELFEIFTGKGGGPDTTGGIGNTAYGALNALTERLDWYRKPRKGDGGKENVAASASGFDPVTDKAKAGILRVVWSLTA